MTDVNPVAAAGNLRTQTPQRLWGISPESVYTALAGKAADRDLAESLSPHVRAETLRTNGERDHDHVRVVHGWMLEEFGLVDEDDVTLLGSFVLTSDRPQPLLRTIAVTGLRTAETVLRSCAEIDGSIPRNEFDSLLADEWAETVLGPLLGSLGFVTIRPDSVVVRHDRIESALTAWGELTIEQAVTAAYSRVLPHLTGIEQEACIEDVAEHLTGHVPDGERAPAVVAARLASGPTTVVDPAAIEDVVVERRERYEQEFDALRALLAPSGGEKPRCVEVDDGTCIEPTDVDERIDAEGCELLGDVIETVAAHPEFATFDLQFVTERLSVDPYAVYQSLSSVPDVDCEVVDGDVIRFDSIPASVDGTDLWEEYTAHLVERCSDVRRRIDALTDVSVSSSPPATVADRMIAREYESLGDGDVAPAYFTYTLVDPTALGEKKMDDYVGDSRGLGRERARLRRWHENRPTGLRSYTAMTDRLFSLGLERELESKVLRIMTPFDDDTFNEYVSQIRRLLERGFELRLLTRHTKEPWEWRRLQRNLLSEIKAHRDRITVRTYSRFKEHQRVTSDMNFRDLGELGIHGKLQTIGRPEEGAALLGSANFMENSYDWNPECGVYTERTQFVDAAIAFFDIVWDVAEADELAVQRLQEVPDHKLVPTYYS